MPLISDGQKPFKERHSVGFWMRDLSTQVRVGVYVPFQVLNDFEPDAVDGVIAILKRHRTRIEELASHKFSQAELQPDTSVLVTAADLSRSATAILPEHSADELAAF